MAAVRQGSRWLHEPPTEEQVKEWFDTQPLHPGMSHEPFYGGIVVIGASEKVKVTRQRQGDGEIYLQEIEQAVFIPYVKVDTRIAYFRSYVRELNEGHERGEFVGVIEGVPQKRIIDSKSPYYNEHLPEGFAVYPVRNGDKDTFNRYLVATFRVAIYERQSYHQVIAGQPAVPVLQGVGTKQSPLSRAFADDNAMMKAETGAIGRALGVAGILVVGTGVATAEDIQESMAATPGAGAGPAGSAPQAALPADASPEGPGAEDVPSAAPEGRDEPGTPEGDDDAMRQSALALQGELEKDYPEAWQTYRAWWSERGFGRLSEMSGPALKGALVKLERDLDTARSQREQSDV